MWLRSPTTMSGYWRDDEATDHALVRDWLRTGDLGFIDERGCLRLAGRLKEMFIRGGYNVYPAEVEAVLADHPRVADVAVVPRPDDVMGEIGVAVVVPADRDRRPDPRGAARVPRAAAGAVQAPRGHPLRGRHPAHADAEGRPPGAGRRGVANHPVTGVILVGGG